MKFQIFRLRRTSRRPANFKFQNRRGVTLIEMLTVVSIIGLLATIGNASYSEVRRLGRDVRRFSDMKQIQTALELYFASHNYYPSDGAPGEEGIILGGSGANALDDARGWTRTPAGIIYTRITLGNPGPNGLPYIYRSLDAEGRDCDANCASYEIVFATEGKMAEYEPGAHALTPLGILLPGGIRGFSRPDSGVVLREGVIVVGRGTLRAVAKLNSQTRALLDKPEVQRTSEVVAPVSVTIPIAGAAALGGLSFLPRYLFAFFTQPFLLFFRRKRKSWGMAYNSLTKLPVDLAIVRLIDARVNKVKASSVTDREGRFSFVAPPGEYRLETVKRDLKFPSTVLIGEKTDGQYTDLYFGEIINVSREEAPHPNIPLDPLEEEFSIFKIRSRNRLRHLQRLIALSGPAIALGSLLIKPLPVYGAIFGLHIILYMFFNRLSGLRQTKAFGVVYDEETSVALPGAVLRLYALPYHKLAETKISDANGRYSFLVGPGEFYLTVERPGYLKIETDSLKIENPKGTTINASIPMRRTKGDVK